MMERCEWNPTASRGRYENEAECSNNATICVGQNGKWHLCESCSKLPVFKRLKKKPLKQRSEAK